MATEDRGFASMDQGKQREIAEQHPRGSRVLEARDRRLRGQAAAVDRIAPQQQFVDRIVGEPVAVIAVGMATRDRKDPLRHQIPDAVRHARHRARIAWRICATRRTGNSIPSRMEGLPSTPPANVSHQLREKIVA